MAAVNRPLSRRYGPKLSYVEVISLVATEIPTADIVAQYYPVYVNEYNDGKLISEAPNLTGSMSEFVQNGGTLSTPTPVLYGASGANASLTVPDPVLSAGGTIAVLFGGQLTSPSAGISGYCTVSAVSRGDLTIETPALAGYSGFGGAFTVPTPELSGGVLVGVVGNALLISPSPITNGEASAGNYAVAHLISPVPQIAPVGMAWLVSPHPTVQGHVSEAVVVSYEAYAINLTTGAVTHYTNYPFDNMLRFGKHYYGVKSDGIYKVGGALDITEPIDAHIKTFQTNFGDRNFKRLPFIYTSGRASGGVTIGVTADEGTTYEYPSNWGEVPGNTNHRTVPGKGIRGIYYALDVSNVDGGSLEVEAVSVQVAPTRRGV